MWTEKLVSRLIGRDRKIVAAIYVVFLDGKPWTRNRYRVSEGFIPEEVM